MTNPLIILTVFYCLGITLAGSMRLGFWVIASITTVLFSVAVLWPRKNYIFTALILFLALLTGVLSLKNSRFLPKCHISKHIYYQDNSFYSLDGYITSEPELKDGHTWFIFYARQIQKDNLAWRCCGKVLVKLDFARQLKYGDNLVLMGNLSRTVGSRNTAGSYGDFLRRQGIYLTMRISDWRSLISKPGNSGSKLISSSFWLRAKVEQIIGRHLGDLPAGILYAMVLGQKRGIPRLVNDTFVKAGTVHILVVSGFNVGIVAFIADLILKMLRIRRRERILLIMACLIIYCLMTGATNPVVRATVMGIIFLSAHLFKRNPHMYNSLAIAALFILIISPGQLFDIGFQLSFLSVLAIVYFYPKLEALIHVENYRNRIWRFICQGCLVSFSAWLGTLGIIAFNFGIISPVTVLANIFIAPLASLITLSGFTLVFFGLLCPYLAGLIGISVSMLINLLLNVNFILIKLPFAYFYL